MYAYFLKYLFRKLINWERKGNFNNDNISFTILSHTQECQLCHSCMFI